MKNDYSFTYNDIFVAYNDCIKNKSKTCNAIDFSIDKTKNLIELCDEINNNEYKIGKSIAFIVKYPVYREVFAANFRDRIVHHLVINELLPYFEKEFIDESFSCRKNKGVLFGIKTMNEKIKECTENYTKDAWVLKMDIKSFFMSINKQILSENIDKFIVDKYPNNRKKEKLRWLCKLIIMHHPELNCEKRCDLSLWKKLPLGKSLFDVGESCGLPIGNLTSQIFANFYLNQLDKFIKYVLDFEYYGRYVDDFLIISTDKEKLLKSIKPIENFSKEKLKIVIHKNKRYLQHYSKGVKFIGGFLKPNRIYIINRTKGNLFYKIKNKFSNYSEKLKNDFMMCVNSYLGYMSKFSTYKIRKKLLNNSVLFNTWKKHIIIDTKFYKKILLKTDN